MYLSRRSNGKALLVPVDCIMSSDEYNAIICLFVRVLYRTNTTRWRTSFHSIQVTSIGERVRGDLRVRSLTPPLVACYTNNAHSNNESARSTSNPGSLHQSGSTNSVAQSSTRNPCPNRLEKVFL